MGDAYREGSSGSKSSWKSEMQHGRTGKTQNCFCQFLCFSQGLNNYPHLISHTGMWFLISHHAIPAINMKHQLIFTLLPLKVPDSALLNPGDYFIQVFDKAGIPCPCNGDHPIANFFCPLHLNRIGFWAEGTPLYCHPVFCNLCKLRLIQIQISSRPWQQVGIALFIKCVCCYRSNSSPPLSVGRLNHKAVFLKETHHTVAPTPRQCRYCSALQDFSQV
jgi:hypothetical protein